jgi:hypothetical protein
MNGKLALKVASLSRRVVGTTEPGWPGEFVIKSPKNEAQKTFFVKINTYVAGTVEKSSAKFALGTSVFSKHWPNRRKFAQSGHPVYRTRFRRLLNTERNDIQGSNFMTVIDHNIGLKENR